MTAPAHDPLADWLRALFLIEREVRDNLEPLSEAQFAWRPGPRRWSIGECLDHIGITTGLALRGIRPALEVGRAEGRTGGPPFKFGALGGWFVKAMEQPGKRGMTSPPNFAPPGGRSKLDVLARLAGSHRELHAALQSAGGLALDRIRAPSAARGAGWLRLNVAAWFAATLAHERRHVAQAKRVTQAPGFHA